MAEMKFDKMHGCACGRPGQAIARRAITLATRHWEVDVEHDDGKVHTNDIKLNEKAVLK